VCCKEGGSNLVFNCQRVLKKGNEGVSTVRKGKWGEAPCGGWEKKKKKKKKNAVSEN